MNETARLIVVDDDEYDVRLTLAALEAAGIREKVLVLSNGEETLDYFYRRGTFTNLPASQPALVLLDLKMPGLDGFGVLETVKGDPAVKSVPIVALTSSRLDRDIAQAYALGVNGYVVKPMEFDEYVAALGAVGRFWLEVNETT
jgi:CheY-like chemotaxis protein